LPVLEGGKVRLSLDQVPLAEGLIGATVVGSAKDCSFELGSSLERVK
jgi:hypothetical protein